MTIVGFPDDKFTIEPPNNALPFSLEVDGRRIVGQATVAEVAACVFVFTIYEGECNYGLVTQTAVVAIKPDAHSLEGLLAKCIPPTAADHKAHDNWLRATAKSVESKVRQDLEEAMSSRSVVPWEG